MAFERHRARDSDEHVVRPERELAVDGEELDVDEGSFDAVISRVGLIYFPDQQRALAGMRRALRPGGRLAAVVYSSRAT